ncbi:MAG TPA: 50S ribosomal protein L19 [Candidatus Paceibacterota bacterium]|nr:50S ribosomal protein L19 [Candidatus Paceibacterota bacterium]
MKSGVKHTTVNIKERANLGIRSGDTVRVWQKIEELKTGKGANKKAVTTKNIRKQAFEGLVLAVKHGTEPGAMFTVRKVSSGVGVEKIFPLYSPMIDSIEVLRRSRTRRAKLYFIREKATSEVKRAMRRQQTVAPRVAVIDEEEAPIVEAEAETEVSDTPQTEESEA